MPIKQQVIDLMHSIGTPIGFCIFLIAILLIATITAASMKKQQLAINFVKAIFAIGILCFVIGEVETDDPGYKLALGLGISVSTIGLCFLLFRNHEVIRNTRLPSTG